MDDLRYVHEFYYGVSRILVVILLGVLGIVDRVKYFLLTELHAITVENVSYTFIKVV